MSVFGCRSSVFGAHCKTLAHSASLVVVSTNFHATAMPNTEHRKPSTAVLTLDT